MSLLDTTAQEACSIAMQKLKHLAKHIKTWFMSPAAKRHALVGAPELWEMKRQFQIAFLRNCGLLPSQRLLDIGCGTLRGGLPVIEYLDIGNYIGIDSRAEVLAEAWREVHEHEMGGKNPLLLKTDDGVFPPLPFRADAAIAFSVLIHLRDDILSSLFSWLKDNLEPDGVFYANVNIGEEGLGEWQGFPVNQRSQGFYVDVAGKYGFEASDCGSLFELGHASGVPSQDRQRMLAFKPREAGERSAK